MEDEEFIKHQQLWIRPLLARAFSSVALSAVSDWKDYLFRYFSQGLSPSYICNIASTTQLSSFLPTAHVALQFTIRRSADKEVKEICCELVNSQRDLSGWVSGTANLDLQIRTQRFHDYITDFLNAYNLTTGDLKFSPFDQHAWDQMIWQHWEKKQQDFIALNTSDDSATSPSFTAGQTEVLTTQAARLPSWPFRSDVTVLGAIPPALSTYKDNALNNIMKHFGPPKPPKLITFTKWGLEKHEPVQSRNDSRYAKSRARREIKKKALAPVYLNGEKIDDFWTYAGGAPSLIPSTETIDFDYLPVKQKRTLKVTPKNLEDVLSQNKSPLEEIPQSTNQTDLEETKIDEKRIEEDAQRVLNEEAEQYPGSETEDDAEVLEDFGDSSAVLNDNNMPWSSTYTPDTTKKGKDSKKPRVKTGSTPPPEVPVKRPESRKATQMDQEIIRDIQTGFNAVNFSSFALLKCAAWLSKSEVWQSVQALLDPGVKYAFTDGRWGLRGVQTQPKRLPRVALPILDQCYDANGNPRIFRKVCLLQPKLSTFASWFSVDLRQNIAQIIHSLPYTLEPFGGQEARTEWRESGKCCPRVSSVKDVLSCMVKVLTTSGQEFTLGLFLNTNQLFERDASNGTYKLENNSAVSSEDLLAFYESLLVEFPCIELIADPFADNDNCADCHLRYLIESGPCQFYRSISVTNGMPGHRCITLSPKSQVSKLTEDVLHARSAEQHVILDSEAGLDWDDNMEYHIAVGVQADFFVAQGCSTKKQIEKLNKLLTSENTLGKVLREKNP